MKFTYFGLSCSQLHTQGKILLFDPFISPDTLASAVSLQGIQAAVISEPSRHGCVPINSNLSV
ncbi:hypothetical protein MASR2M18_19110 [Ignavibacteria bacterium]|nr:hypothetical protein [Bacteroidota bacterium]MCZ2133126.1 hypothetical protein [Bacteroidota bacterium]